VSNALRKKYTANSQPKSKRLPSHDRAALARREKRGGALARVLLLLALVTVASSSRGDTLGPIEPEGAAPSSIGVQAWQASASYNAGDIVEYSGQLYKAGSPNTDEPPSASPAIWQLLNPGSGAPGASGNLNLVTLPQPCVVADGAGSASFTAVFGYSNSGIATAVAPINATPGPEENAFAGLTPAGQGQPTAFQPGAHPAAAAPGAASSEADGTSPASESLVSRDARRPSPRTATPSRSTSRATCSASTGREFFPPAIRR
jgi:hypothetical protein